MFKKFAAILLTALILSCALFVPAFAAEGKYVFMDVNTGKDGRDGLFPHDAKPVHIQAHGRMRQGLPQNPLALWLFRVRLAPAIHIRSRP